MTPVPLSPAPAPARQGRGGPELWGGLECSVVRVGPDLRDQFRETGHHDRGLADLEAASLRLDDEDRAAIAALPKDRRLVDPGIVSDWDA